MNIVIVKNYQGLSKKAANIFLNQLALKSGSIFGLATGSTPLGMYQEIIKRCQKQKYDFSQVKTFNLDEYYGLAREHPQSYHYYMWENFFKYLNIKKKNIYIPDGMAKNINEYCQWYETQIKKHPIDLQILGLGVNGHVGFNEPGSSKNSLTRLVDLSPQTIKDNIRFFANIEEVPKKAITMGIKTIKAAKRIILLASGKNKAKAVQQMIAKKPSINCPASWLQKHSGMTVIIDKKAAILLKRKY